MPYGDGRVWNTSWKRIQPIPANEIGDTSAGATSNVQQALDRTRRYAGLVANVTARNALTPVDGDWVVVQDGDGAGNPQIHVYAGSNSTWRNVTLTNAITSVNGKTGASITLSTTDVAEGTNLYYTNARADARVQAAISATTPSALGTAAVGAATTWARADHVHAMPSAANVGALPIGGGTLTGKLVLPASTAALVPLNVPTGAAPTTPASGDLWNQGNVLKFNDGTATRSILTDVSTLDATKLSGALPALNGSALTSLTAANLAGALPAISGASLTGITASQVGALPTGTTTSGIAEGTNLYYTQARADARVAAAASSTAPAALGTAAVGVGTTWARADHVHAMPTAAQVGALPTSATTDAVAEGTTNLYYTAARADARVAAAASSTAPAALAASAAVGTGTTWARADHVHALPTAAQVGALPTGTTTSGIAEGTNLYYTNARADARVQAAISVTTPSALGTAAVGTATTWAKADHVHAMPTAANVGALPIGGGTLTGKLTTLASAAGGAGLNLPSGAAPTTPGSGDLWNQSGVLKLYDGTATRSVLLDSSTLDAAKLSGTIPNAVVLPTASTTQLGGVKVDGTSITIASGVISATPYALPTASTTVLGGVKVDGTTITITNGVIAAPNAGNGTVTSVNGKTGPTVTLTTSDIAEGTNLYYTDARADARIAAASIADSQLSANVALENAANVFSAVQSIIGPTGSQLKLGSAAGQAALLGHTSGAYLSGLADWDGTQWLARGTSASAIQAGAGVISFNANTGLTSGTAFSQNTVVSVGVAGLDVKAGTLSLSNATSNLVQFTNKGIGAPTFTTRSAGTKLHLWNDGGISGTLVEYAIGIESGAAWFSVPSGANAFKFYGGTTVGLTVTGTGALTAAGTGTFGGLLTASNGLTVSAGSVSLPAGSIAEAALAPAIEKRVVHATDRFVLGNNDSSALIYSNTNGAPTYSASGRGMSFTAISQSVKYRVRMPIDPGATYHLRAKLTKISGNGSIYIGADSLDNSYNSIATDTANSYNYFAASNVTVAAGSSQVFEGTISGYNATNTGNANQFDPEAKFFDIVVYCNYNGTGSPQETVLEWLELRKVPNKTTTAASTTTNAGFSLPHGSAPTSPVNGDLWTTTAGLYGRINGTSYQFAMLNANVQWSAKQTFLTATTSAASINIPSSSASPSAPASGDLWNLSGVLKFNDGTATRSLLTDASTLDATKLSGNLPALNGSALTSLSAANLTGALPAISGASLTGITASQVGALAAGTSTDGVAEGTTNLYYTNARADARVAAAASSTTPSALGTAAVGVGTTWARADHVHALPTAAQVGALSTSATTDAVAEGTTNLYYTQARVDARVAAASIADSQLSANVPLENAANTFTQTQSFTGGTITLDNATANWIAFKNVGVAAPSYTTRSGGTKIVLFPGLTSSAADYAVGIENTHVWFSTPSATSSYGFNFYGGTTLAAQIASNSVFTLGATGQAGYVQFKRASDGAAAGYVGYLSSTESNVIALQANGGGGAIKFVTAGQDRGFITSAGRWGLGTINPSTAFHVMGGARFQSVTATAAPTTAVVGTAGTTTYYYWIVSKDAAGNAGAMSPAGSVTTANATLSATNYVTVSWTTTPGAPIYDVLRTTTSVAPTGTGTYLVGTVTNGATINDQSNTLTSYTVATRNATGDVAIDGQLLITASAASGANFRLPHGTTPSAPSNGDVWTTTAGFAVQVNGATHVMPNKSGANSWSGKQTFAASTTSSAGLNIPTTGAAPSSPSNGDLWATSSGLFMNFGAGPGTLTFAFANVNNSFSTKQTFVASTTSQSTLNLPSGVAPTSPLSGDVWNQSGVLKLYDGTATRSVLTDNSAVADSQLPSTVRRKSESAFMQLPVSGHLNGYTSSTYAGFDLNAGGARTLAKLAIMCPQTPASGTITIDVLVVSAQGGAMTSLFPTKAKPTITCNGGAAWAILTGASLETTAIPDGCAVFVDVVSAPTGAYDLSCDLYE